MLEATYDDKGNAILYEYKQENADGIDPSLPQEKNRLSNGTGFANKYLKRIHYGNREPYERDEDSSQPDTNFLTPISPILIPARIQHIYSTRC